MAPPPSAATAQTVSPPPPGSGASEVVTESVAIDVDKVKLSLRDYRTIMGENPTGTNAEIAQALNGGNRKQARLLQEGLTQNANGELVDRWGTPYFFHQLSKDQMQIRSAGPDRTMWTDDDVIGN
ncbi:MAG: type II secretion system protein GspG [Chthoniobacteraceae bacterium]